jgi:hypothetical protein
LIYTVKCAVTFLKNQILFCEIFYLFIILGTVFNRDNKSTNSLLNKMCTI